MLECLSILLNTMKTADTALFQWVPIRTLAPRHRERAALHLLALEPHDRYPVSYTHLTLPTIYSV